MKLNTNIKVTFNPKSKVREINSHGERGVIGSQTLLYRPFRDAAKIMFYIDRKKSLISISFVRQYFHELHVTLYTGSSKYVNISACHMGNTTCLEKSLTKP